MLYVNDNPTHNLAATLVRLANADLTSYATPVEAVIDILSYHRDAGTAITDAAGEEVSFSALEAHLRAHIGVPAEVPPIWGRDLRA